MTNRLIHYEIFPFSLTRHGEEVCGDQVKMFRTPEKTILVLSDGLGCGIKATILARLTTEIIGTMLRERARLRDVVETVAGTLPTCRVRDLAYATFAILQIEHGTGRFQIVSFDNPAPVLLNRTGPQRLPFRTMKMCGKAMQLTDGTLENGDFLGLMSDGVLHADESLIQYPGWDWNDIAQWLARAREKGQASAERLVLSVMDETNRRYAGKPGDDATFVGVLVRNTRRLILFTGPPSNKACDEECTHRFMSFAGRRVICGGTTANIVAENWGEVPRTESRTAGEGIPPTASLPDVDLVTEGILTMARALEHLKECEGDARRLPFERNGAILLARELLSADSVLFLAGESVNPYYQNPQLPRSISIRRSLVTQLADQLTLLHKDVSIEWI
jgi:hypothetical protein